ncbi:MAG: hypothetical protein JWP25_7268 [Bradyrhizobium sp.]|nr:hypothetical protein [Bradyrhizobium sp.]
MPNDDRDTTPREGFGPNRLMDADVTPISRELAELSIEAEFGGAARLLINIALADILIKQLQDFRDASLGLIS